MQRLYEQLPSDDQVISAADGSSSPETVVNADLESKTENKMPNLFEYKLERYFGYEPLDERCAAWFKSESPCTEPV